MAIEQQTFDYLMHKLDYLAPIPSSFKENLKLVLSEEYTKAGTHILNNREIQKKIWLIISGTAREYTTQEGSKYEHTKWFWFENDIVYTEPGFFTQQPAQSYIEILEDSHLVYIDFQNFQSLKKAYPELELLLEQIREHSKRSATRYLDDLRILSATERYQQLFKAHPKLFNIAKQKDIAYFLGISPDTLGRLRKSEF